MHSPVTKKTTRITKQPFPLKPKQKNSKEQMLMNNVAAENITSSEVFIHIQGEKDKNFLQDIQNVRHYYTFED
jgi:hypothetical protein